MIRSRSSSGRTGSCSRALTDLRRDRTSSSESTASWTTPTAGVVALYAELDETRGPPAAGRRDEVALPVEHEPRVPHPAQLDPRAEPAAPSAHGRGADVGAGAAGGVHPQGGAGPVGAGRTICWTSPRSRPARSSSGPTEFDVTGLFGALRGMLRPLLVGDAVQLVFDEPDGVPTLHTDEAKISQILRNFISNALKFTEQGEIRVSARRGRRPRARHVRGRGHGDRDCARGPGADLRGFHADREPAPGTRQGHRAGPASLSKARPSARRSGVGRPARRGWDRPSGSWCRGHT